MAFWRLEAGDGESLNVHIKPLSGLPVGCSYLSLQVVQLWRFPSWSVLGAAGAPLAVWSRGPRIAALGPRPRSRRSHPPSPAPARPTPRRCVQPCLYSPTHAAALGSGRKPKGPTPTGPTTSSLRSRSCPRRAPGQRRRAPDGLLVVSRE